MNVIKAICFVLLCSLLLAGCGSHSKEEAITRETERPEAEELEAEAVSQTEEARAEISSEPETVAAETLETEQTAVSESEGGETGAAEPTITEGDWEEYFDGFNGAAVIYDASAMQYTIYNNKLAQTRRSPCSTFKIISSLIALENDIIEPEDAVRTWSGEIFWNEKWNRDIGFKEAFRDSCVWYFREVTDEIGQETMQRELDRLQYGNCDISDWEGRLNTNNHNRALTGFWIESSLVISPKEQTEVMERIFGTDSVYSTDTRDVLKQVMLVTEQKEADCLIYGKTGMGKKDGVVLDAWFTGFAEKAGRIVYFCVYLGRTDDKNVSSTVAKEMAIQIVSEAL